MKLSKSPATEELELNMTPMIDVVFLLIIFFMTVSELTKIDTQAELQLPKASKARIDDKPEPDRLVLNVVEDGNVVVQNKTVVKVIPGEEGQPDQTDVTQLIELLRLEAELSRENPKKADSFAERAILIRADEGVEFRHVQRIMLECIKQRIWKLSFGATNVQVEEEGVGAAGL